MTFLYILCCTLVWYLLYFSLKFSNSIYLQSKSQWLDAMTVAHAFLIPSLVVVVMLTSGEVWGYTQSLSLLQQFVAYGSISFYIFSAIETIRVFDQPDKGIIAHHVLLGTMMTLGYSSSEAPAFFVWVLAGQATAIFYHTYLILKSIPTTTSTTLTRWYNYNFYSCLLLRVGFVGLFFISLYQFEARYDRLGTNIEVVVLLALLVYLVLNVYWISKMIVRKFQKRKPFLHE